MQRKLLEHFNMANIVTTIIKCVLFIVTRIMERKWVHHPLFNFNNVNSGSNRHGLKMLRLNRP